MTQPVIVASLPLAMGQKSVDVEIDTKSANGRGAQGGRPAYERPRVELRGSVAKSTLVSGEQCVFDPPPC